MDSLKWVKFGSAGILAIGLFTVASTMAVIDGAEDASAGSNFLPALALETVTAQAATIKVPKLGDMVATLEIPRLKRVIRVIEGTESAQLKKGAGHFSLSVLPGFSDNSVIAGHRDSVFSQFGSLKVGDPLIVQTSYGKFTYFIKRFRIVKANDRTVIVPTTYAQLTLSTCYPFRYVGNAPERFIVIATLGK